MGQFQKLAINLPRFIIRQKLHYSTFIIPCSLFKKIEYRMSNIHAELAEVRNAER